MTQTDVRLSDDRIRADSTASVTGAVVIDTPHTRMLQSPFDRLIRRLAGRISSKRPQEIERFIKFATVGVVGAIVDFGVLNLLLNTVLPPTEPINVTIATSCGFIAAVTSNFIWNRYWTYPDSRTRSIRRQLTQFTLVSFIGWSARTLWISLSYAAIGAMAVSLLQSLDPGYIASLTTQNKIGSNVAQLFGVFVVMIWNFFVNRYWTYNDVS